MNILKALTAILTLMLIMTMSAVAAPLPASVQAIHNALTQGDCNLQDEASVFQISASAKLYIVPCNLYAYQSDGYVYLAKYNDTQVVPVTFLTFNPMFNGIGAELALIDPVYDQASQTIDSLARGRALGDCGQKTRHKVVVNGYGVSIKTVEIRYKGSCDGNTDDEWPVVFKQ